MLASYIRVCYSREIDGKMIGQAKLFLYERI